MNETAFHRFPGVPARAAGTTLVLAALLLGACATTAPEAPTPRSSVAIQEDVGFTIVEESAVSESARSQYDEALRRLEQGDVQGGVRLLELVVSDAPELAAPHIDLGIAYHLAGDLEAAEASLKRGLTANPSHPIAFNELGIIYRKTGRFSEARDSYEAALSVYPGYHFARRNLAILCDLYLTDPECALANYRAYMETVPGDDEAAMWIADLEMRMQQGGQ